MNGTSALINEDHESSFAHSAIWDTEKRHCLWTRKQVFTRHQICQHPHLPSLQNCEKNVLFFISYPACAIFVIAAQTDGDTPNPALCFNIILSGWRLERFVDLSFTYFEANIFHALPTITSSGFTKNWLLLTNAADFSYLLRARWVFHTWKASSGASQDV